MQSTLLRFLETGELQPVGRTIDPASDVRDIGATNRDLNAQVATGAFRADLFYRLRVVPARCAFVARAARRHPAAGHLLALDCHEPSVLPGARLGVGDGRAVSLMVAGQRSATCATSSSGDSFSATSSTIDVTELSSDVRSSVLATPSRLRRRTTPCRRGHTRRSTRCSSGAGVSGMLSPNRSCAAIPRAMNCAKSSSRDSTDTGQLQRS